MEALALGVYEYYMASEEHSFHRTQNRTDFALSLAGKTVGPGCQRGLARLELPLIECAP